MLKITLALTFALSNTIILAQSISVRKILNTGANMIVTSLDTISLGNKYCAVEGNIFNEDSTNLYGIDLHLIAPQSFYLSRKNTIQIRCINGFVYDDFVITDGLFIQEAQPFITSIHIPKDALNELIRTPISSISLVTQNFRHKIEIDYKHNHSFQKHLEFMNNMNVYDEIKYIRKD
jgi:hypothetical protein